MTKCERCAGGGNGNAEFGCTVNRAPPAGVRATVTFPRGCGNGSTGMLLPLTVAPQNTHAEHVEHRPDAAR